LTRVRPGLCGAHPQEQRGVAQHELLDVARRQRAPQPDQALRDGAGRAQQRRQQRGLQRRHAAACAPRRPRAVPHPALV